MAGTRDHLKNVVVARLRAITANSVIRYLTASGLTALVYFGLMIALHELAGLGPALSLTIAYLVGLVIHFMATKLFTFQSYSVRRTPGEAAAYIGLVILNYCIALGLARLSLWLFATMYPGTLIAPLVAFLINYPSLVRVFRKEPQAPS